MSEEILAFPPPRADVGQGLSEVCHASYRRLVVQMYGVVGDISEAEDLVQEAFVRAAAAGNRFLRADNHEAWLRTTALNVHRRRRRKLRKFAKIRDRLEQPTELSGPDQFVAIVSAVRSLPEPTRQMIALHYLADLPVAEVASILGCPVGTVKSRLQLGRESLAVTLGSWWAHTESESVAEGVPGACRTPGADAGPRRAAMAGDPDAAGPDRRRPGNRRLRAGHRRRRGHEFDRR